MGSMSWGWLSWRGSHTTSPLWNRHRNKAHEEELQARTLSLSVSFVLAFYVIRLNRKRVKESGGFI